MRALYGERRRVLAAAIEAELGGTVLGSAAGLHLVATLPARAGGDRQIAVAAAERGLSAMPLSSCYLGRGGRGRRREGLVLGFAGTDARHIRDGVRRLAEVLAAVE
jgi:GntR family transcriptional regulator/MocR family aminotransferase